MVGEALRFSAADLNPWASGAGGTLNYTWDKLKFPINGSHSFGFDWEALEAAGNLSWAGSAGLVAKAQLDAGSVAIDYTIDPGVQSSVDADKHTVSLNTGGFKVQSGNLKLNGFDPAESYLKLSFDYDAQVDLDVKLGAFGLDAVNKHFDVVNKPPTSHEIFSLNASNLSFSKDFGYGTLSAALPHGGSSSSQTLVASDDKFPDLNTTAISSNFLRGTLDLDLLAQNTFGLPGDIFQGKVSLGKGITKIIDKLGKIVDGFIDDLGHVWSGASGAVVGFVDDVTKNIRDESGKIIGNAVHGVISVVTGSKVVNAIRDGGNHIIDESGKIIANIEKAIEKGASEVIKVGDKTLHTVKQGLDIAEGVYHNIVDEAGRIIDKGGQFVAHVFDDVGEFAQAGHDAVKEVFGNVFGKATPEPETEISLGYLVADISAVLDAKLNQMVAFDPDSVTVVMTPSFGEAQTGKLGDTFSFATPAGVGVLKVDATYTLAGHLANSTAIHGEASVHADALDLTYKGSLVNGPLLHGDVPNPPLKSAPFKVYENGWEVKLGSVTQHYEIPYGAGSVTTEPSASAKDTLTITQAGISKQVEATLYTGTDAGIVYLFSGTDADEKVLGTAKGDFIKLLGGNDIVDGGGGDDKIDGGDGNDTFNGGDGNDHLIGWTGKDTYTGGAGNDIFTIFSGFGNGSVITDFTPGSDKLDLSGYGADARLSHVGDSWTVKYSGGSETFTLNGVSVLPQSDANVLFA